jgi:anion-transporting  ArsA/GET3 family ATPase
MQQKYLKEAFELYDGEFHIVQLPLLTEEVRGPEKLREFSKVSRGRPRRAGRLFTWWALPRRCWFNLTSL